MIDNPYMPFMPGTRTAFEGVSDGERERNVVVVTDRTKMILGVTTTVVHDRVFSANGDLAEDTLDWYAQDRFGNVWYFGGHGRVRQREGLLDEGIVEAGVDGAQPGIVMLAQPAVGERYHQEFLKGEAEDVGAVVAIDERVTVPYGSFDRVVVTEDTTPLEPQILEHKFFARDRRGARARAPRRPGGVPAGLVHAAVVALRSRGGREVLGHLGPDELVQRDAVAPGVRNEQQGPCGISNVRSRFHPRPVRSSSAVSRLSTR